MLLTLIPSLMAGGRCIASFMARQGIVGSILLTTACLLAVVFGGLVAIQIVPVDMSDPSVLQRLLASACLVIPTWFFYWIGSLWLKKLNKTKSI
jgi:hypothetical protein